MASTRNNNTPGNYEQQQIGIAISGGIFVMPSPIITRSGFRGTLPYDI